MGRRLRPLRAVAALVFPTKVEVLWVLLVLVSDSPPGQGACVQSAVSLNIVYFFYI